jgi:hypothetical protein
MNQPLKFGIILEDYQRADEQFEDYLIDVIGLTDWSNIHYNDYLCQYYINDVDDDNRITPEGVEKLKTDHAIHYLKLRHKNGIETSYPGGFRKKYDSFTQKWITNQPVSWAECKEDL